MSIQIPVHCSSYIVCVCVCVCVRARARVRGRERGREGERGGAGECKLFPIYIHVPCCIYIANIQMSVF